MNIPRFSGNIPYLTAAQMIEVDRAMMEDYRIGLIQMMENAGRNLANLARVRFLDNNPRGKSIFVMAGTGGNGGGAFVCGRHLSNWGADVFIYKSKTAEAFSPVPGLQLRILENMRLPINLPECLDGAEQPDLIIDGVIGYSLQGDPRGGAKQMIEWANEQTSPILALDVPSGLELTSGTIFTPTIRAAATMTLALPKAGLRVPGVEEFVGELYLADISVPPALYAGPGLELNVYSIFAESELLRLP